MLRLGWVELGEVGDCQELEWYAGSAASAFAVLELTRLLRGTATATPPPELPAAALLGLAVSKRHAKVLLTEGPWFLVQDTPALSGLMAAAGAIPRLEVGRRQADVLLDVGA